MLATHFLGEAGRLADQMAVLHKGRLEVFGRPAELAADLWQGIGAVDRHRRDPSTTQTLDAARARCPACSRSPPTRERRLAAHRRPRGAGPGRGHPRRPTRSRCTRPAPTPPTLEDVYFEIERRIVARTGEQLTDGFLGRSRRALERAYEAMPESAHNQEAPPTAMTGRPPDERLEPASARRPSRSDARERHAARLGRPSAP